MRSVARSLCAVLYQVLRWKRTHGLTLRAVTARAWGTALDLLREEGTQMRELRETIMTNCGRVKAALLLAALFAVCSQTRAADFYVDTGNPNANDNNPGSSSQPWKTIAKANQTLMAGQRVYIKQGLYNTYISPTASGTPSNPITYAAYGADTVTISNVACAVLLVGKSNIVVQGINGTNCDQFISFVGASHNTVSYGNFNKQRSTSVWSLCEMYLNSQYNWIHHCVFGNAGYLNSGTAFGTCLYIGNDGSMTDHSDFNLIEYNVMFHGGHDVMYVSGSHNVIRNNYLHNENWSSGYGERCLMSYGYDNVVNQNLFDGNRIAFSGNPPPGAGGGGQSGMSVCSRTNIIRRNCFYGCTEPGLRLGVVSTYYNSPQYNAVYNNTYYSNSLYGLSLDWYSGTNYIVGNMIKNNLFYRNLSGAIWFDGSHAVQSDQVVAGNWIVATDPLFTDITTSMDVRNPGIPDFQLRTNSPCIDQGSFLTIIISLSGSGDSFQVAEPSYFMDGWGIVQGDQIQLQGSTQKAIITNINYATKTIRVDGNISWAQNQGISLAYTGAAPDVGAFEFGATAIRPSSPGNLRVVGGF